jgi:hypothetical protein
MSLKQTVRTTLSETYIEAQMNLRVDGNLVAYAPQYFVQLEELLLLAIECTWHQ